MTRVDDDLLTRMTHDLLATAGSLGADATLILRPPGCAHFTVHAPAGQDPTVTATSVRRTCTELHSAHQHG